MRILMRTFLGVDSAGDGHPGAQLRGFGSLRAQTRTRIP